MMLPDNVLYYGKEEPLPEQRRLRAGPLTVLYEEGDLRYIRLGSTEIVRRIYVAVRDRNWGTVAPVLSNVRVESGPASFRISYEVRNRQDEIDFIWTGEIAGDEQGTIRFSMEGEARSDFLRKPDRVLHPAPDARVPGAPMSGREARRLHGAGRVSSLHLAAPAVQRDAGDLV